MKIEKLKKKIVEQLTETELYTDKQITRFTNEIKDEQDVWGLIRFLGNLGFSNEGSIEILFKILVKVPEPSSEERLPGAPDPKDWEDLLKALRKTYGTNVSWYNDKRKSGRRIKIVGVRNDVFRKQVYDFIHKLGYDVHEHITEHTAYPKTLVVFFKE